MSPQWRDIEPGWVNEAGEIETWLVTIPIVLFMYVRFHHVDRVKRQFGSEQPIPLDRMNLDGFLHASARGEDKWWPAELDYWRSNAQPGGEDVDEEAEYRRQEDIPDGVEVQDQGGDDPTPHEADIDFFSCADIELARFILHGEGFGSGSAPHASVGGSSGHHLYGPP
ncbi:hypothetical protein PIB30_064889 [Stylosanthes scabra]|uniref:Uncharacterized protein n=1 Tax=Stylosanthes scabra TaxID=79078 RepID=A0ABU6VKD7_9FABA|nr:hypothetical protein [Stylosanthes scabra]